MKKVPHNKTILLLGKLPPPYMGPSVAFKILVNSGLKNNFNLHHLDVKANESLNTLGKWSVKKVFKNLEIYGKLVSILKKEKPDLVLIPISQAAIGFIKDAVYIILCKFYRCDVVVQLRGSNFLNFYSQSGWLMRKFMKYVLSTTTGVFVLGNNLRYLFESFFDSSRIFVCPNGATYPIPVKRYNNNFPVKIIYLANLQPSKGIEDVIEALVLLQKSDPHTFEMTIIGEWRNEITRQKCLEAIHSNSLPVTIHTSGVSDKKFEYLLSSDIFVFTPREPEGHPWVIVEAMASGLPIISTNQGAIVESVVDGSNGFIVNTHSPGEIAAKLKLLITDPELRETMGKNSRERYERYFTEEVMVANYTAAFEALISSKLPENRVVLQD